MPYSKSLTGAQQGTGAGLVEGFPASGLK